MAVSSPAKFRGVVRYQIDADRTIDRLMISVFDVLLDKYAVWEGRWRSAGLQNHGEWRQAEKGLVGESLRRPRQRSQDSETRSLKQFMAVC
jgi:hypothetical protein